MRVSSENTPVCLPEAAAQNQNHFRSISKLILEPRYNTKALPQARRAVVVNAS